MYSIKIQTAPASEPVTATELKTYLRLNTTDEDSLLADLITVARQQFEHLTQTGVISQTVRQYVSKLDQGLTLMRGPVASITALKVYDSAGTAQTDSTYSSDTNTVPGRIWWTSLPAVNSALKTVAYVDYLIGYANAGAVPADIKLAVKLRAADLYANRESLTTDVLTTVPLGFKAICAKYALGLDGDYYQ